jgi:hypothetical protein
MASLLANSSSSTHKGGNRKADLITPVIENCPKEQYKHHGIYSSQEPWLITEHYG